MRDPAEYDPDQLCALWSARGRQTWWSPGEVLGRDRRRRYWLLKIEDKDHVEVVPVSDAEAMAWLVRERREPLCLE